MINLQALKKISEKLKEPKWIFEGRRKFFNIYENLEMPSFRYGNGIHADISHIDFSMIELEETIHNKIECPSEVQAISLSQAIKENHSFLKELLITDSMPIQSKIMALHGSFFNSGIIIKVPDGLRLKKPIYLRLNLHSSRIENILILAGKNSKVSIVEISNSDEKEIFRSHVVKIIALENSYVEYITLQNLGGKTSNFCKKNGYSQHGAEISWIDCEIGSRFTQNITSTFLNYAESVGKNLGIILGSGSQCFDINYSAIHSSPNTKSNISLKAALNDNSKKIYSGMIEIKPNALFCEGYQKSEAILLGEDAEADAIPNLKISNNDVKCSHSATISQVDKEKLFYMMSRGLSESMAIKEIVRGFFDPIFQKIQEDIGKKIADLVSEKLGKIK